MNLSYPYVVNLIFKFMETGSVLSEKREMHCNTVTNKATQVAILEHVQLNPTSGTRKMITTSGIKVF